MLRSVRVAACAAVLVHAPLSAAFAAPAAKVLDNVAPKASPAALACANRYNKAMRMEDTMRAVMQGMIPMMTAELPKASGPIEKQRQDAALEAITESVSRMTARMLDDLAPVMAVSFNEAELCALAAFYESDVGQSVIDKMPKFTADSAAVTAKYMPLMLEDMMTSLCRKIDCEGPANDPTKAVLRPS